MPKESLDQNRIAWIDNLRTMSLFAIVLVHTSYISKAVVPYLITWYVPAFFFISGLFVKEAIREQKFLEFAKVKFQRLLIPYLTFGILTYIPWIVLIGRMRGEVLPANPLLHFLANMLYGVAGYGWFPFNVTLWFFPCLFVTELLFFFLIRLPSRKILIGTLFVLSVIGYFYFQVFNIEQFRLPFGIDIALTAVVFYGIGYLTRSYILNDLFTAWYSPPSIFFGLVTYIIFSTLNYDSAFVIGNFGKNYFYFYLAALSGVLFWMQVSRILKPIWLFQEVGKNTLVIFPLHLTLFPFFSGILIYGLKIPKASISSSSFLGIFYAIAAVLLLLPVAWSLNRYAPFLLGKISSGKKA